MRQTRLVASRRRAVAIVLAVMTVTGCGAEPDSSDVAGVRTSVGTEPTTDAEQIPGTTVADVTFETGFELPDRYERPSVPADAVVAANVVNNANAAAIDDALASLEASLLPGQILVSGDFSGCILIAVWALPMPSGIAISYEMHPSVDCAVAIEYRAFFVIDRTGTNSTGTWDYVESPAITVVQVSGVTG